MFVPKLPVNLIPKLPVNLIPRLLIQLYLLTFTISICADDTEIFFGGASSASGAIAPNVLFVLDTSSSMTSTDGLGVTRLDRMKEALRNILTDSNNINVGLMRFSNAGGPVLYPISAIDGVLESDDAEAGSVAVRINQGNDDVEQSSVGAGGSVTLNASSLTLVEVSSGGAAVSMSITIRVDNNDDDVEESSSGPLYMDSSDLEFLKDGNDEQVVGIRFNNVNIPQGATVTAADIEFIIDETKSGNSDVDVAITAHDTDDAVPFDSGDSYNVSSRPRTSASITWQNNSNTPSIGELFYTTDFSSVVQEIIDRAGWTNNNSMVIIFEKINGTGIRTVETHNTGSNVAPMLRISYTTGGGGPETTDDQIIGLRFNGVEVPQGVTITSASVQFAASAVGSDITSLTVRGEDSDNSLVYSGSDFDVTGRTYTTASAAWVGVPAFTVVDEAHLTPDLSAIVQEIIDRTGWCGGNSMSFKLDGTGKRLAKSFEADPSQAPYLRISFDPDTIPESPGGCINTEISARIKSGNDDAEEYASGGMYLSSSDLELVTDGDAQTIGMRFQSIPIDQGTSILSAYIEFTVDETDSGSTSLTIKGHDVDDSAAFTGTNNDISNRTVTTASAAWSNLSAWNTLQEKQQSVDISAVIQEIVNRTGWSSGNALSLIITGSGKRVAESYEGSSGEAARLVIRAQGTGGEVAAKTVRSRLIEIVDEIQYKSGTPIVDTLYEAALYYRGDPVDYGAQRGGSSTSRREHTRVSHINSLSSGTINQPSGCTDDNLSAQACRTETIVNGVYQSPIDISLGSCQQNYIVLLTDGSPSVNESATKVKTMAGITSCQDSGSAACGQELAKYMFEEDQIAGGEAQTITTYTIGFNFSDDFIKEIAANGGGSFFEASTSTELTNTFSTIIKEILKTDTTFVAPGATVNQFNRLTHRNELYFSLFKPDDSPRWIGNLKRYELAGQPLVVSDINGVAAIDPNTGFFKTSVTSFWSSAVDGNQVAAGGAAENLPSAANRKLYTYLNTASTRVLSHADNAVASSNSLITKTILGIEDESDSYRTSLLDWTRGFDVLDEDGDASIVDDRHAIGDPLHSKPTLVTYGGTSSEPDITIFFTTNEGFLHAIDADTGVEVFSFIPQQLMPNLDIFYLNSGASNHPYGLDGSIVPWVNDVDGDGQIEASDGDFVYLFFGMRRGGRNYYALDVTDRSNPELIWVITGGINSNEFEMLGDTWSTPVKTTVVIGGTHEEVLIFAGGYHENQDAATVRTADAYGNAIFMVRAGKDSLANGGNNDFVPDLLWSAGNSSSFVENMSGMDYSIPGNLRVIDLNGDGLPDQMYIGDMGGQLWRFDIDHAATNVNSMISGGIIGTISGTDAANNRRFYHSPDAALISIDGVQVLNIAIGSGYRAHPLDQVIDDRFYSFRQTDVFKVPSTYTNVTESGLYDATDNLLGTEGGSLSETALAAEVSQFESSSGWFIKLENSGEKVLARSLTINNQVLFTTYEPNNTSTSGCVASIGTARAYAVSIFDATPVHDFTDNDVLDTADRKVVLLTGSIPPEPVALIPDGGDPIVLIGPEAPVTQLDFGDMTVKTYWSQHYEVLPAQ